MRITRWLQTCSHRDKDWGEKQAARRESEHQSPTGFASVQDIAWAWSPHPLYSSPSFARSSTDWRGCHAYTQLTHNLEAAVRRHKAGGPALLVARMDIARAQSIPQIQDYITATADKGILPDVETKTILPFLLPCHPHQILLKTLKCKVSVENFRLLSQNCLTASLFLFGILEDFVLFLFIKLKTFECVYWIYLFK